MSTLSFFRPMLEALNDGKTIRSAIVRALQALALLLLGGGVYLLVDILKASSNMTTEATFGAFLFGAVLLATLFVAAQIVLYRAKTIGDVDIEEPFLMLRVSSALLRAFGEIAAVFLAGLGSGGCIFLWLARDNPLYYVGDLAKFVPTLTTDPTILGGVFFLGCYLVYAFVSFVAAHLLAEACTVVADLARTVRHSAR